MSTPGVIGAGTQSLLGQLLEIGRLQREAFSALMEGHRLNGAGNVAAAAQYFARNIALSKEAIGLANIYNQKSQNPIDIAPMAQVAVNSLFVESDTAQSRGDVTRAEALRNEAVVLSKMYLGISANAESERSRASSLIMQGRFNEALIALASARDQFQAQGEAAKVLRVSIDMVDILHWLNDNDRAARELSRASATSKPILEQFNAASGSAGTFTQQLKRIEEMAELARASVELDYYQGLIQKDLGNFGEAEQCFLRVLPQYQGLGVGEAIQFQLAVIFSKKGEYPAAWSLLQQLAPKIRSDERFRPKLAALLKIQAEILYRTSHPLEALLAVNQAITDLSTYMDPDVLWRCWALRSELLVSLKRYGEALESYQKTAAVINSLRIHPLGYRLDSTFLKDKLPVFEGAIDLCCANSQGKECAEFADMLKSRALLAVLSTQSVVDDSASTEEKQLEEVTQKLDALDYREFREGSSAETENLKVTLLSERSQLLERLRYSDPRWRSLSQPIATDLTKVSDLLAQRSQAAITLYYRPGKIVAVLLQGGSLTAEIVEVSSQTLGSLNQYLNNLHSLKPDYSLYDLSASLGVGARHLIPPRLLEMGLTSNQLLIVPHGPLHLVPWAGLIFNGRRLFQYCAVGILPNLGCISVLNTDFAQEPRLAAIGAPDYGSMQLLPALPNAEKEIQDLAALYADQIVQTPLTGKAATRANFWRLLGAQHASGILHVTCHATFEPLEPMRSGLLLADAKVDAAEIARSRIPFHEVVLSACSTGYRPTEVEGVTLAGDDILGLPAAFLEAGAAAVLVSIPTADDQASAALVVQYHEQRRKGRSPLTALQQVQLAMLESQFEPFQWIGFTGYATT